MGDTFYSFWNYAGKSFFFIRETRLGWIDSFAAKSIKKLRKQILNPFSEFRIRE